jgi:DNA-binding response OmpR family regulator
MAVPKKIVIVEDEPDTAEMFAEMMRLNGYQVRKAFGSRQAMTLISQENPDAVMLDIMMPDVSGLEVLHYMRRDPQLSLTPVVVISAKSLPSDIKTGLEAGANAYLTKPVSYLDLKKTVDSLIRENQRGTQ